MSSLTQIWTYFCSECERNKRFLSTERLGWFPSICVNQSNWNKLKYTVKLEYFHCCTHMLDLSDGNWNYNVAFVKAARLDLSVCLWLRWMCLSVTVITEDNTSRYFLNPHREERHLKKLSVNHKNDSVLFLFLWNEWVCVLPQACLIYTKNVSSFWSEHDYYYFTTRGGTVTVQKKALNYPLYQISTA